MELDVGLNAQKRLAKIAGPEFATHRP